MQSIDLLNRLVRSDRLKNVSMKHVLANFPWLSAWLHLGFELLAGYFLSLLSVGIRLWGAMLIEHLAPKACAASPRHSRFNLLYTAVMLALVSACRPLLLMLPLDLSQAFGLGWLSFAPGVYGWICGFICVLVLTDFLEYLFHRAQHAVPLLWRMHELHHSAEHYDVTLCYRHFWLEPLIKMVCLYPLVAIVFKVPTSVATAVALVFMINHHVAHMNLAWAPHRVNWLFSHPQYHRLHHSRHRVDFDKNFCDLLPLWDIVFRTFRAPLRGRPAEIGLEFGSGPETLREALLWPWRGQRDAAGGRLFGALKAQGRTTQGIRK